MTCCLPFIFFFKKDTSGVYPANPATLELGYRRVAKNQGNGVLCPKLWFSTLFFFFSKYHKDLDKSINASNNPKLNVNKKHSRVYIYNLRRWERYEYLNKTSLPK